MKSEILTRVMSDGQIVYVYRWTPDKEPVRAVVQISHGMGEHAGRYERLAAALTDDGYAVYADDHRGHGLTGKAAGLMGYFGDKTPAGDSFERVTEDEKEIGEFIREEFPQKKLFLLGHSCGSFIAQDFIEKYGNETDGCILSGSSGPKGAILFIARFIASAVVLLCGRKKPSFFIERLVFGNSGGKKKNGGSVSEWLTRDKDEAARFNADPLCNFTCAGGFYADLFATLSRIHGKSALARIPADLPVLIISGTADPVGDYGKSLKVLEKLYRANGVNDTTLKLYQDARHELFNETNRAEVTADTLNWLNARA